MSDLTNHEYWAEIQAIANNLVSESMENNDNDRSAAEDEINDCRLHEDIDGHQWVIYYAYNLDVIKHSENDSYFEDNFGLEGAMDNGLDGLHVIIAFWCMYADVQDYLETAFDEYEANLEAA